MCGYKSLPPIAMEQAPSYQHQNVDPLHRQPGLRDVV